MPPRRRRDGDAVQARTREQSFARVRVPVRRKAPRFFRRCRPSRGGIRGEPRLGRRAEGSSRPLGTSNRRPGCPELHEEGTRELVKSARNAFARELRPANCPVHASGTRRASSRRVQFTVRRPLVRQRTSGQRNRHRLVPASSGAKAPLAREDRRLVGCARASIDKLQKSANDAEVQRSVTPRWQRDTWTGTQPPKAPQGSRGGAKASDASTAVAKPWRWKKPEPDARKGVAGQGFSLDGRHLGSSGCSPRSRERAERRSRRPSRDPCTRERHGPRGGGDRGVRGSVRTHRGGKTTPIAVITRGDRATHRSELLCRGAGNLSGRAGAQASDAPGTDEARVPIRRREMAEVGPTHRASQRRGAARRAGGCEAGRGTHRTTC
jgi:hypothetical protein